MNSDFKKIVKDSLRDAFYTKKEALTEALIGKEISIEVWGKMGTHGDSYKPYIKYPSLLGKNVIPHELPYRLTWFSPDKEIPVGHVDMTHIQFTKLMNGEPDTEVYTKLGNLIEAERIHVNLEDEGDGSISAIAESIESHRFKENNELLLLLEDSAREIDLWLENKTIEESMNLYVKGADYSRYDSLGAICNRITDKVLHALSTLPQDQQEYWKKHHAFPTYEIVTPDGPYYDSPKGVINFYTSGLTQQALRLALKTIFDAFKTLGLKWGKIKTEQSGAYQKSKVIRIPILQNPHDGQYKGPLEMNMANRNAYHIFHNVLQFEPDDETGSGFHFTTDELLERINSLRHDQDWIDKHGINPTDSHWPEAERGEKQDFENPHDAFADQLGAGGARFISGGLSGDDIRGRLMTIYQIAHWAKKNNYKEMYVA